MSLAWVAVSVIGVAAVCRGAVAGAAQPVERALRAGGS